jgi:hypothetical protein
MAAQLTEEGRFPAVQRISKAEYERFVDGCENAAQPIQKLKDLMNSSSKAKYVVAD